MTRTEQVVPIVDTALLEGAAQRLVDGGVERDELEGAPVGAYALGLYARDGDGRLDVLTADPDQVGVSVYVRQESDVDRADPPWEMREGFAMWLGGKSELLGDSILGSQRRLGKHIGVILAPQIRPHVAAAQQRRMQGAGNGGGAANG